MDNLSAFQGQRSCSLKSLKSARVSSLPKKRPRSVTAAILQRKRRDCERFLSSLDCMISALEKQRDVIIKAFGWLYTRLKLDALRVDKA